MNRLISLGVAALIFAAFGQLQAQEANQQADDEIAQGRAMVQAGREQLIRYELSLTDEESEQFWPIYAAYTSDTKAVMDRYTVMITNYVRRYDRGDLSDEYASDLLETFFSIKQELLDIKKNYLAQFNEVLPGLKVARFYQLENKIEAEIDAQLALAVPLIESN